MDKLLTKKDLAERWQLSERTIDNYITDGIVTPIKKISAIRFNPKHIADIEGTKLEPFSPLARKQLENKIADLELKVGKYEEMFGRIMQDVSVGINLIAKYEKA